MIILSNASWARLALTAFPGSQTFAVGFLVT